MATEDAVELSEVEPKRTGVVSQVSFSENTKGPQPRRKLTRRFTDISQTSETSRKLYATSEHRFNADERKRQRWEKFKLNCLYFEWMFGNAFMRMMFRLLSFINLLSLVCNSVPFVFSLPPYPDTQNHAIWTYYYITLLNVDVVLALLFTVYVIGRGINAAYWKKHSSKPIDLSSYYHWSRLVTIAIITVALFYSVAIEAYRLACIYACRRINNESDPPYACNTSELNCPPFPTWYLPFIARLLSIFPAMRALAPFQRLRISNNVMREFTRYLKVKHLVNVAIFYVLMVFIYAVIGVHVIGPLSNRCVDMERLQQSANMTLNESKCYDVSDFFNADNESRVDGLRRIESHLAIPDRHCRQRGVKCSDDLMCLCLEFPRQTVYQADYPHIGLALLSVYESSTLELWTRTLYDSIDGEIPAEALLFFFTMVFFLVILVQESIFLVVIIESFAAVRSESYIERKKIKEGPNQYLVDEGDGKLRLVQKEESTHSKWRIKYHSYLAWFHKVMLVLVMVDAVVMATRSSCSSRFFDCNSEAYGCYLLIVALWQLVVSVVFVVEVVVYLVFYGPRKFFRSKWYWGLTIIAVVGLASAIVEIATAMYQSHDFTCGSLRVPGLPTFTPLILAQACRLLRLLSLYDPLYEFYQQVVGKDKRIILVSLAVITFILIMATINIQFFAFIPRNDDIDVFPDILLGFQSQFQLLFQEGWIELLSELMHDFSSIWWLINIWIVLLHFVASLILLNFFTAIILDNLDLDEETKVERLKQALAAETVKEETIPRHWKWSTIIGGGAETVKVPKPSGFDGPAVKKSVMEEYLEQGETKRTDDYITVVGSSAETARLSPWEFQGLDDEDEDASIRYRLRGDENRLRLVSTSDSGRRGLQPMVWGQRERQQSVGHIIQQIKLLRKLRRFDVNKAIQESPTRQAIRFSRRLNAETRTNRKVEEYRRNHRCFDRALFCMPPGHPVRKLANRILNAQLPEPAPRTPSSSRVMRYLQRFWYYFLFVVSIFPFFKWFILLTTVGFITMQFTEDLNEHTSKVSFKAIGDALFVVFTLSELILKILAHGLFFNPYAAISSIFDVLDWIIVVATFMRFIVLIVVPDDINNYNMRQYVAMAFLLVFWSLRPLRIISIVPQVREVLTDVWRGRKIFLFAFVLFIGFVFIFSSLSTQLFSGALGKCNDPDVLLEEDCIGEFPMAIHTSFDIIIREPQVTITVPRVWITEPRDFQFDNILFSFTTLFSLLPLEGWIALRDYLDVKVDIHNNASDIVNQIELKTLLHLYVFIGANLGLTLFVGVIVANYNENKSTHAALLTVGQKQWLDLLQRIQLTAPKKIPPAPPYTKKVAYFLYSFVNDFHRYRYCQLPKWIRPFRTVSALLIICNALTLWVRWTKELELVEIPVGFSIAFNAWFIIELFLKMIAYGIKPYFYSFRNWVDCLLSFYSAVYCIFAVAVLIGNNLNSQPFAVSYENLADMALASAVARCITILGKYEVLTSISITVAVALLNSISLMILMVAVLLVYANWGTALFGQVTKGEGIEMRHATFSKHDTSLYLGIRILTGEDWYQLMWDTGVEPPYCRPDLSDCGQPVVSILYFLSFFFILFFIILNIFKAVLLEAFSVFYSEDDTKLNHTFLKRFRNHWSKFDPTAKGIIPLRHTRFLIRSLALEQYYSYRVKDNGEKERVEVNMISDALVLREMYRELVLTVTPELKLNEDSAWQPGHKDVEFASVLRMLAYKAEDVHKRLKPDELVEREILEQSIQDEVATHCIHLWVRKYVKTVVGSKGFLPEEPAGPTPIVIVHQTSLHTDTTEDEGEFPTRPQNLPISPAKVKGQDVSPSLHQSALSPHAHLGAQASAMLEPVARREPEPVDPNHLWLEMQMEYDSDDEALYIL